MNPWAGLRSLPREIWILFFSTLINRVGTMVLPFLALYVNKHLHFSVSRVGIVLALYGIGAMFTGPLAGVLCDRYGANNVMKASLFSSAAVLLAFPLAQTFPQLVLVTLLLALTTETFRPACLAYASQVVTADKRKAAFAVIRLSINLGMSIGPAVGGFLAAHSFQYLFWIDGITSAFAGTVLVMASATSAVVSMPKTSHAGPSLISQGPWRDRTLLYFLLALIPVMLTFFQHISAMPLYVVRDLHFSEAVFGLMFTINTVLIILIEVPLNLATAHWSFSRSLSLGSLLFGIGFGGLAFAHSIWGVAATVVIWTFGEMILFPSSSAYVAHLAPPDKQGQYMGLYTMSFSVAFTVGPWMGAELLDHFGPKFLWITVFFFSLISALLMLRVNEKPTLSL